MSDTPGWTSPQGPERAPRPEPNVPAGWSAQQPPPYPPQAGSGQSGWGQPGSGQPGSGQPGRQGGWGQPRSEVKPGIVPLRPLGVGEILDGAISCIRAYPRPMLGLSAIVAVAAQLLVLAATRILFRDLETLESDLGASPTPSEIVTLLGDSMSVLAVTSVITGLAQLILTGILTVIVSRAVVGQEATARDAWTVLRPQLPRLVGLALLLWLMLAGILLVGVLPGILVAAAGATAPGAGLAVLGGLVACVAVLYVYVTFTLSTPALVLERQSVIGALSRSRQLVRGSWWRVCGILLLVLVITWIISSIIVLPFSFAGGGLNVLTNPEAAPTLLGDSIQSVGAVIAVTITYPFSAAVGALLYVDQRMRREALDLELARAAGVTLPGQPDEVSPPPGQPGQPGQPHQPNDPWQQNQPPAPPPPTAGW